MQERTVKGGIAAVIEGYYGSRLEEDFDITYVESYRDGSKVQKLTKALGAYRQFRKVLRNNTPDLVHVHSSFGPSFFRKMPIIIMAHRRGIPILNHIHGSALDELYTNAGAFKQWLVRRIYGYCDRLVVLSDEWREKLSVIVPKDKISVVSNYCIIHDEMLTDEAMSARYNKKQILYLGRFDDLKGVVDIPAIADIVKDKIPGVKFILGGSGDTKPTTDEIARLHLEDTVILPGWITGEQKTTLLKESAIFLLPSHMEAMPMSILEAMGYALPIVSTEVGGIPQVVAKDINGRLYAPRDIEGFAKGITDYLTDESSWREASTQSLEIANKKYSFNAHIENIEKLYNELT